MWNIVQRLLPILLILIVITQVIYPLIMDTPLFWMFRRKTKSSNTDGVSFEADVEKMDETFAEREKNLNDIVEEIERKAAKIAALKDKTKK